MRVKKLYEGSVITDDMLAQWYCEYYGIEVWKDIPGYEGLYQASTLGRIRSLPRSTTGGRVLTQVKGIRGYLQVSLCKDGIWVSKPVHRLIAITFIANPYNLPQVNHKDEDKHNNNLFNLEWCTGDYNHSYGTINERIKENNVNGKCSKQVLQFSIDGMLIKEWSSQHEIERTLGYSHSHISKCCYGKLNQVYGYVWKFKQ